MPIYEYECEKCNTTFEAMQSVSSKPLKKCNKSSCKGKVHRLVSASGFIFKGSGWFTSEYPSDARKKGWESESQNTNASKNTPAEKDASNEKKTTPKTTTPDEKIAPKSSPKKSTQKSSYPGVKKSRTKPTT
ncbi:MAG: zinc ribbon domain-containing protein [Nitrospina sp.]|jgi:putative FmdB family regulatory protein|nr:zinc ribbon domain-containing protein [Nitrospina sp.]MBT4259894.1 zinc ribbon domain-containing protein [Nitrospina sp.]MBT5968883.1 zinc ribbon domain-containing protein [Nitrospina sp.]MBT6661803.1 zinc ribbon domain-containing protein [Nitrospina sp.]MBT7271484.1 zinc ribbon domain-containing protein [Nitrospina sp.]|tara:strand:+ start:1240 stop:1635 length:396 start_codon:yes stop_codon:yes gene_type:complete